MSVVYIDLKSAYNTIDRKKLFNIIRKKEILNEQETDFLEMLNNNIYFETKDGKILFRNGVH